MKQKLKYKRKGAVYVWFVIFVLIGVMMVVWTSFSQAFIPDLIPTVNETLNSTRTSQVLSAITNMWNFFPLVFIFALFIWGVMASQKREYDTGYY